MPKRALRLRREPLTELAPADLSRVVAGEKTTSCATVPLVRCLFLPTFETTCRTCE